jgi:hypothetical protein
MTYPKFLVRISTLVRTSPDALRRAVAQPRNIKAVMACRKSAAYRVALRAYKHELCDLACLEQLSRTKQAWRFACAAGGAA